MPMSEHHHIIAIGSGFATSFFLNTYLRKAPANASVLVLERGPRLSHETRVSRRMETAYAPEALVRRSGDKTKEWLFSVGFGGSSNCWWACTPRMTPSDFRLKTLYGVGRDWPVSYDQLERDYGDVEQIMGVSGGAEGAPYPRSRAYPQPPHNFSNPDRLLKAKYPSSFFHQPTARARRATANRPACCANAICSLCPVDAKFTVENGFAGLYRGDPRVRVRTEAEALWIDIAGGKARGVTYRDAGGEKTARADLVVLGANAIFNPFLMLKSGMSHPLLGRRLAEQTSTMVTVDLKGVENFQGSTSITGHGYMFYDGDHRRTRGACLVESWNKPDFRLEPGRWREVLRLKFIIEDLPSEQNRVEIDPINSNRPLATFEGYSAYARATLDRVPALVADLVAGLPVERIHSPDPVAPTEGHVQCTTVMGADPTNSVVDPTLRSHQVRNLVVLGASVFPTAPPANPTLTLAALSSHAARRLVGAADV